MSKAIKTIVVGYKGLNFRIKELKKKVAKTLIKYYTTRTFFYISEIIKIKL